MASIEERISNSGKKSFRVKIRMKGHPSTTATFARKTDAVRWAQQTEVAIQNGKYFKTDEAKKHTLSEMIDRYIKTILPAKKSAPTQKQQLEWWKDQLGDYRLSDIKASMITSCRDALVESKKSNATVNRYLAALSHLFTVGLNEWEWIDSNPMSKVSKLKEPRGRVRFLTQDELERLYKACKQSKNQDLYTVVILALSTGARKMEIWGLHWNNVDLINERIILEETKNNERRAIPLKWEALDLLREKASIRRLDTDLVFPGKKPWKPMDFRAPWIEALKQAKIEDFRWHDLRHTAASYLAMNGATLMEIAHVLGHKTLDMVKRYSHLSESYTAEIVESMNKKMIG